MRYTVLVDNRSNDPALPTEHGLSVLLEASCHRILLDTGASDLVVHNAQRLGIDLHTVDYVFLSHGHADHAGGLSSFLQVNDHARIIVSAQALSGQFYSKRGELHSITPHWPIEEMRDRLLVIETTQVVDDDILVIANIGRQHPVPLGNRNLYLRVGDDYVPDAFRHELALCCEGFLFSGCAHSGVENILDACAWPVHTVLGGLHLLDAHLGVTYETPAQLRALAERLQSHYPDTQFLTSHCTGDAAYATLHDVMGEQLHPFGVGVQGQ